MISADFKVKYNERSGNWPPDAQAFCLTLLSAFEQLEDRVKTLEDKLAINSGNSSIPPSKDSLLSPVKGSMREKSGKQAGGQTGHTGQGGKLRDKPDD